MKMVFPAVLRHVLLLAAVLVLALNNGWAGVLADDLLEPEKAFRISTRALDGHAVEVRFEIADGYYMYRDRFKFETASGKLLAEAELPSGVRKKDQFFGETETYRREVRIRVPLTAEDIQSGRVKMKVTSQGCSDLGVCYVPLEQVVDVKLGGGSSPVLPGSVPWKYLLFGLAALTLLAVSYRYAPRLARSPAVTGFARRSYPALGFALAALAVWALSPLLVPQLRDLAWGALLVITGVGLRAVDPLPPHASGVQRFAKGLGFLGLAAGVILLAFAGGARNLLVSTPTSTVAIAPAPQFERVARLADFDARVRNASTPTMLDFYADWCVTCKEMERFTFSDPQVRSRMQKMQLLQVDVTRNTPSDKEFLQRFGIFGPPAILFFDRAGNEVRRLRVIGYQSAERFRSVLDDALRATPLLDATAPRR